MNALIIETSTERSFVAIWKDGQVRWAKHLPVGYQQSKYLMPEIEAALQAGLLFPSELDCIGVGVGPGSYTGIRIGVAIAKGLAYAWKLPLIGFCSLQGFIPTQSHVSFAVLIDAKIGGVYLLTGIKGEREIHYTSDPSVCSLDQLGFFFKDIQVLVTPYSRLLKEKVDHVYKGNEWQWEERDPDPAHIGALIEIKYQKGEWSLDGDLEILYLRQTEAEREKKDQKRNL